MLTKKGFYCIRCGKCCKYPVKISLWEKIRIRWRYPELNFYFPDIKWWQATLKQKENDDCIFLEEKNGLYGCKIFDIRPKVCRKYPFFGTKKVESCFPEDLKQKKYKEASEKEIIWKT